MNFRLYLARGFLCFAVFGLAGYFIEVVCDVFCLISLLGLEDDKGERFVLSSSLLSSSLWG
jgi:hypothetical protein